MNETPFYLTKTGRQFYESTMPELVRQLHRLNDMLGLLVELAEVHADPKPVDKSDVEES